MKKTHLILLMLSLVILSCDHQEDSLSTPSKIVQENFAIKNVEILNELGEYFPKEDLVFTINKDKEGKLFAIYKLVGQTRDEIDLGSFAKRKFEKKESLRALIWRTGFARPDWEFKNVAPPIYRDFIQFFILHAPAGRQSTFTLTLT